MSFLSGLPSTQVSLPLRLRASRWPRACRSPATPNTSRCPAATGALPSARGHVLFLHDALFPSAAGRLSSILPDSSQAPTTSVKHPHLSVMLSDPPGGAQPHPQGLLQRRAPLSDSELLQGNDVIRIPGLDTQKTSVSVEKDELTKQSVGGRGSDPGPPAPLTKLSERGHGVQPPLLSVRACEMERVITPPCRVVNGIK